MIWVYLFLLLLFNLFAYLFMHSFFLILTKQHNITKIHVMFSLLKEDACLNSRDVNVDVNSELSCGDGRQHRRH